MSTKIKIFSKIILVILFFVGIAMFLDQRSKEPTIVLTEKGFSPAGIKVSKGTVVKFINKTDKDFWPASDFHPNHTSYPEFDPKMPIPRNDSWKMQFNTPGTFRYHDHITPVYRGTIVVVDNNSERPGIAVSNYSFSECGTKDDIDNKRDCFSSVLQDMILKKGPDKTFEVVKKLRDQDPDFAAECHTIVHSLGQISYWKYSENNKLPQTGLISTCGFGFIHGFMQELGHHSQSFIKDVQVVCNHLANKIDYTGFEQAVNPADQCYHGVGHGLAYFYVPDNSDNLQKAVSSGVRDCEDLTSNETSSSNCKYGIFGGISSMYVGGHGIVIPINEAEPFSLCNSQEPFLKDACFDSMVPVLGVLWNKDLDRISKAFSKIDLDYQKQSFYNFGDISSRWVAMGEIQPDALLKICSQQSSIPRLSCFKGFVEGLIRNGFPKTAPKLALNFCESKVLTTGERKECQSGFLSEMKLVHPDKIKEILSEFNSNDKKIICENESFIEFCD